MSDKKFLEFVIGQLENVGEISYKKLLTEYGLYSNGNLFGIIFDNELFIKPTKSGKAFINKSPLHAKEKPGFLNKDKLEDKEWICQLVRITIKELSEAKIFKKNE